ncbi:mucin-3A-like [Hyperolius riggenbachi]|uniref:mucin-3A-like n=1 Tax=Hyperolius riggenbachi TaxID=752182 RepID=UPI0035A3384F
MDAVYSGVPGYKGVKIISIRNGSIVVDHEVIVEVNITAEVNVPLEYEKIFEKVQDELNKTKAQLCTENSTDCIDFSTEKGEEPNLEDFCLRAFPDGFGKFYDYEIMSDGLTCMSHCDGQSLKYYDCNGGKCDIKKNTGPQCYCSDTDKYIYTSSRCEGKILKSGLYGGIGVSTCVLAVIVAIVSFFLIRKVKSESGDKSSFQLEEDEFETWSINRGSFNPGIVQEPETYLSGSSQNTAFQPSLERVNTSIQVKIKRPEICHENLSMTLQPQGSSRL